MYIVAVSRKEMTNAIPGVAIATALMPPLCVAGFGLARGELDIFLGAFYLFFINSVFIALATFLIVRYLRFPYKEFMDDKTRRRAARWIGVFVFLIIIPSVVFMYNFSSQFRLNQRVERFISEVCEKGTQKVLQRQYQRGDSLNTLTLVVTGQIPEDSIRHFDSLLAHPPYRLPKTRLRIIQDQAPLDKGELLSESALETMNRVQPQLDALDRKIDSLRILQSPNLEDLADIEAEIRSLFPQLQSIAYAPMPEYQADGKTDTIPTLIASWAVQVSRGARIRHQRQLGAWLKEKWKLDTLRVVQGP